MVDAELNEVLKDVHSKQVKLLEALQEKDRSPKDKWDKFSAIAPFITGIAGVLIALMGIYFTRSFNQRQVEVNQRQVEVNKMQLEREADFKKQQVKLSEIQTVGTLLPYLAGSEKNKEVAIIMIAQLTNTDLAGKIIAQLGGPGGVGAGDTLIRNGQGEGNRAVGEALISLSKTGKEDDKKLANEVLASVFRGYTYMGVQGENITIEIVSHNVEARFAVVLDGKAVGGNPFSFKLNSNVGSSMSLLFDFSFLENAPNDAYYEIKITSNSGTARRYVLRSDPIKEPTFKFQIIK